MHSKGNNLGGFWYRRTKLVSFFFKLGTEMGVSNPAMKTMKTVMRIMCVAMIPLTAQFPAVSLLASCL